MARRNLRADGETGRRTTLKMWHRKVWEFDSPSAHLNQDKGFHSFRSLYTNFPIRPWMLFGDEIGRKLVEEPKPNSVSFSDPT